MAESIDGETLARVADVSDGEAMSQLVADVVEQFGQIDVLINNAGVAPRGAGS